MRKIFILMLLLFLPVTAMTEVYHIEDEAQLPQGWQQQELLRVTFFDMQRSDAILLQCGGENMMVDGGLSMYYQRLFRMLDERGVTGFKYLWNTHCDGDHSHGLRNIMNSGRYGTGPLLCPNPIDYNDPDDDHETMVMAAQRHGWTYTRLHSGDVFTLGGATITCLRCDEGWGQNNRSACCFVDFGDATVFLTGDIGIKAQQLFVETVSPQRLDCDILKAPHHGLDPVTDAFFQAVSPEAVVITNPSGKGSHASWSASPPPSPYMCGDGTVVCETNGADWYIWQLPDEAD